MHEAVVVVELREGRSLQDGTADRDVAAGGDVAIGFNPVLCVVIPRGRLRHSEADRDVAGTQGDDVIERTAIFTRGQGGLLHPATDREIAGAVVFDVIVG